MSTKKCQTNRTGFNSKQAILQKLFLHHCHYSVNNNSDTISLSSLSLFLLRSSVLIKCHEDAIDFRVEIPRRPVTGKYTIQSIKLLNVPATSIKFNARSRQTLESIFESVFLTPCRSKKLPTERERFSCPINWFEGQQKCAPLVEETTVREFESLRGEGM